MWNNCVLRCRTLSKMLWRMAASVDTSLSPITTTKLLRLLSIYLHFFSSSNFFFFFLCFSLFLPIFFSLFSFFLSLTLSLFLSLSFFLSLFLFLSSDKIVRLVHHYKKKIINNKMLTLSAVLGEKGNEYNTAY